ncbi:MAG TPA: hydrogen peroxide-dependent heme synthase [Bryobacteraceae bacterium]|nr:hydrogen peroxide-dependent heme synthase [Bryobacteraceae bacterium]
MAEIPAVPLTLEGSYALHQMFRLRRREWRKLALARKQEILRPAVELLSRLETGSKTNHPSQSALYSQIGHKGDLLFLHFRDALEDVHRAELSLAALELSDYLEVTHSYLSVTELGLYESSAKTYGQMIERGLEPHSAEWKAGIAEVTERQQAAMASRLYPEIPAAKYLCFYPMDRKRAEEKNWYTVPMDERQRMMHDHGMIGRRYADSVRQIITGSIGFDDWEWGVDLFAEDPLVFKKLIYEMRFDEVSAVYALFGKFYLGIRTPASELGTLLDPEAG